ncbi:DUF1513 domain-containing protein [Pelagibacterium lentulum]|uniref:Uncharacterized protein n=1 Tax=Pelagibacterium lentulum TaxID=2029865 RepID=A0A916R721_9HYPH|nr:DUF1513 domain-containing protein [Pelagibacterium lentulum]GGA40879.1 hypothetical protein GCM10011499_08070 [Pelagibacterium lentulum]
MTSAAHCSSRTRPAKTWLDRKEEDGAGAVLPDRPPLVERHRRGKEIELFFPPDAVLRRMDDYIGSVAIDRSGTIVATTSPHGGLIAYWDTATGACLGVQDLPDGCGIAPQGPGTLLSTSGRRPQPSPGG